MPGLVLRIELALDHHLRSDARVVGARLPQSVIATHAVVTCERVHDGVLEGVTHVQTAGHVGRRNHDAVRRACAAGAEITFAFPRGIPTLFNFVGRVSFFHGCETWLSVAKKGRRRVRDNYNELPALVWRIADGVFDQLGQHFFYFCVHFITQDMGRLIHRVGEGMVHRVADNLVDFRQQHATQFF